MPYYHEDTKSTKLWFPREEFRVLRGFVVNVVINVLRSTSLNGEAAFCNSLLKDLCVLCGLCVDRRD